MRDADTRLLNEKKRVLPKGNPNKKKETHNRASRVAPFSPPDDAQKRSTIDSHRSRHTRRRDDARARAFLPSRAPDRAPFSTSSLRPDTSSSLHPRERKREREPQKHREKNEKKKEAPTGGPTRDLRTPAQPPSLARSHKDRRENRGSSSIEKTRAARERERERERESHRVVPFFRSYKQNVKTMKVSSSPTTKKNQNLLYSGCLKFRVL